MVSATSLCLLVIGLAVVSSQSLPSEADYLDAPQSERRTFSHKKPVKVLPLFKKHKKFGAIIPHHVFSKVPSTEVIYQEAPRPIYKVHRYQGIEVKPVSDASYSTPEPIVESHSVEPHTVDFGPTFTSDHSYPPSSGFSYYPDHDKPTFSVPSPPKPIISYVPPPQQPAFSQFPIAPAFPVAPPSPIQSYPPVFTQFPTQHRPAIPASNPFPTIPISFPVNQLPQPIFQQFPVKVQVPVLPQIVTPTPTPDFSSVKIPAPVQPSPAPVFPISVVSPTPLPSFAPTPIPLSPVHLTLPSLPIFHPPSVSPTPEPEFPYPPSGTPIQSYIKDISLGDIEIKDTPLPTVEAPKFEEVTPTTADIGSKDLDLSSIKPATGFFQKIKGWKADKANAALSFAHFKPKPSTFDPHSSKPALEHPPVEVPSYPTLQIPGPIQPLPLAPAMVFFPPTQFHPPRYENFPPNNVESSPLLNSYGVPVPHDTYAPAQASHDRLSSAASEEQPSVVQAPANKQEQNVEIQQQSPFQPQAIPHDYPVYIPEDSKTVKEGTKTTEDAQSESSEPNSQGEASNALKYPNHKE